MDVYYALDREWQCGGSRRPTEGSSAHIGGTEDNTLQDLC